MPQNPFVVIKAPRLGFGFRFWLGFKILWDLSKMRPRRRSRGLQSGAEGVLAVIWQTGDLDGAKHGFEHEHIKR